MKTSLNTICFFLLCIFSFGSIGGQVVIEAESFENKGGWVVDPQFIDQMGSPFLMAHGLGIPVADASTKVTFQNAGHYNVFARTRNWAGYWSGNEAPGKFNLIVNGVTMTEVLGTGTPEWKWQRAGSVDIQKGLVSVALHDLTGFNGRCDAIIFSNDAGYKPSEDIDDLKAFRRKSLALPLTAPSAGKFDLVVIGGGMAGTCTALSAARLGIKVALIQDRPVLGGNNSSEVRVHLGGRINLEPYPALGNLVNEIGPSNGGNAKPAENYEDGKKLSAVLAEKNISLFLNYRATNIEKDGDRITAVTAVNIESGTELKFSAPLFADCTGDGTIGFLAGALYMVGREGRDEFNEPTAPGKKDKLTMGSSVQWYSEESNRNEAFPVLAWGNSFDESSAQKVKNGEWTWETGMQYDQIKDFERIRDYGLLVVFSNWSFLKNQYSEKKSFEKSRLKWVAYIAGKRESRRLVGDYVLKEQDLMQKIMFEDGTAPTSWTIDLHYPDPQNTRFFPGQEFLSIAVQTPIYPCPIPYRCLYSKNIENLFMAGRDISVTHVALGTVRVQRTTGMMGEVVGMAAALCTKYDVVPRSIYDSHLSELKVLMKRGTGRADLPEKQNYNLGETLLSKEIP